MLYFQSLSEVLFNTETTIPDETQLQSTPPRLGLYASTSLANSLFDQVF